MTVTGTDIDNDVKHLLKELAVTIRSRERSDRRISALRVTIRETCPHQLVVEDNDKSYLRSRVCLTCGLGEVAPSGHFRLLGKVGRLVESVSIDNVKLDDPNVKVQFFTWCAGGHFVPARHLAWGYCEDHMPDDVRRQRDRYYADEAFYNTPG
jgi:hypothetical protein